MHRDLKPENILLTAGGHVKLADFGSAFNELTDADRSTEFVGTALYVSPEVLGNRRVSALCGLWGAGRAPCRVSTGGAVYNNLPWALFEEACQLHL